MSQEGLHLRGVSKNMGDFRLGPIDLKLRSGQVTGFIGPNGAGKTTTMKCIGNIYYPETGSIEICGQRVDRRKIEWKQQLGYLGNYSTFFESWSCRKNLQVTGNYYGNDFLERALELAEALDLPLEKPAGKLSSGNRQKLGLVRAMSHHPRVLVLDEPLVHLDPLARDEAKQALRSYLAETGATIFISTHVLNELSDLADRLVFIMNGSIASDHLAADLQSEWVRLVINTASADGLWPGEIRRRQQGEDVEIISSDRPAIETELRKNSIEPLALQRMSLEEIGTIVLKEGRNATTD